MAGKSMQDYTTAELEKMAKNYKTLGFVYIGFFVVYIVALVYFVSMNKMSPVLVVAMMALIVTALPMNMMRSKIDTELKRRAEANP